MKASGAIILVFALLNQALPLSVNACGEAEPECRMRCCCDTGASGCPCAESPGTSDRSLPVNTPPVTGRELVPQIVWVAFTHYLPVESAMEESMVWLNERPADTRMNVRLAVLFCSILI
ncbi:MAG: hypothetical protein KA152_13315 [Verrucomicrobiales bacterium]|mgnify:CR=1 FL=1|nr:hypothetical protein [Verrucomicrobiales bacterium]HQW28697.1 hypothetical protein [Verrucomicrobiales bacterium]